MTAKKKAFRIFGLMRTEIALLHDSEILKDKIAKNLSLIAVDEILKQFNQIKVSHIITGYITYKDFEDNLTSIQNQLDSEMISKWNYWNDVKQEIEKL